MTRSTSPDRSLPSASRALPLAALALAAAMLPDPAAAKIHRIALAEVVAAQAGTSHEFTEDEVVARTKALITERLQDGVFPLRDARSGTDLELVLDDVKLVRGMKGEGWFPNVVFHDKSTPAKKYAVDFWLLERDGELVLMDTRVQKEPVADGSSYMMITRSPLAWWWLPTIERASAFGADPAWKIMADVHHYIAAARVAGSFAAKSTGSDPVGLELIDVEQPVLRLKSDGRFLVCALFRGSEDKAQLYAVPFHLDGKSHAVTADRAEPLASPDLAKADPCSGASMDAEVIP